MTYLLAGGGVAFAAVALVGLVRLPDCYTRAHATSKAETLGALLTLAAAGVALDDATATVKLIVLGVFLFVTSPAAAHAVVRSARQQGIPAAGGDEPTEATDAGEEA